MKTITVCKSGNLLAVSDEGGKEKLPEEARRLLEPHLVYQKRKFLYGADRYDKSTGYKHNRVEVINKQCFRYDNFGRLVTNFGFIYRLVGLLKGGGYVVDLQEASIDRERANCYEIDFDKVTAHFTYRER